MTAQSTARTLASAAIAAAKLPLLRDHDASSVVAYRNGRPLTTARFLCDVERVAGILTSGRHVLNTCADRYRFAVGLAAILVTGRVSLLPSTLTGETIEQLKAFAPDAFHLTDGDGAGIDLPLVRFLESTAPADAMLGSVSNAGHASPMPAIPSDALVAYVFTSGSTGTPVPHRKTWGALVDCVRAEARILGLVVASGGRPPAILGTVPPQHMYGFESTVLIGLQNGLPFSAAKPLFPADICKELEALPRPRVLVTTPFHLRTLLEAGIAVPPLDLIVSATAPLSPALARRAEDVTGAPVREIYGATETGQIASRRTLDGPAWRLFPGVRLGRLDGRIHASGGHVRGEVPLDDVIEPLDDASFELHGRSADMINIAGKRSSLGYLNHQLCAVTGVVDGAFVVPEQTVDGVTRLNAVVVAPTLDQAALRAALRERLDPAFLPRRIVFVDALPRNATGKLPAAALERLLDGGRAAVDATSPSTTSSHAITFSADHPAFAGHFPGSPIVPGVVLLDAVLDIIVADGALDRESFELRSAKFFRPIGPGTTVEIRHRTLAGGAIEFEIDAAGVRVAAGTFAPLASARRPSESS